MEVPRTKSGGPIFDQVERFFDKTVALCSFELVNKHSDRRQWTQPKSMGARSISASDDFAYQRRVAMLAEAQRSIISTRNKKALSRAFLSRARSSNDAPSQVRFAVGDQVMFWRGKTTLGPGIVIGHEVWISHRNAVVKAAGNHVRHAEVEEQLPWHDLYDSLRETDEQTYFDLSPHGVSRDPQYAGPYTSNVMFQ